VQPTLSELGESLTGIIDRVEDAGKETVSIINRNRELRTQIANLSGCRRVLTETIAILDLVQQVDIRAPIYTQATRLSLVAHSTHYYDQGHDAVADGKFHIALRTLRVVKRLRLRSLCTVGFGLYIEKRLPLLVDKLFAATLQVWFRVFTSSFHFLSLSLCLILHQSLHSWLTLAREKCLAIGAASLAASQSRKQVAFSTSAVVLQPHLNMDLTPAGDTLAIESSGLTFGPLMQVCRCGLFIFGQFYL
jgi:hypothetical protein